MRYFFTVFFLLASLFQAQVVNVKTDSNTIKNRDTLVVDSGVRDSMKIFKPTIYDYKFRTQYSEEKIFDTVFTHNKYYVFSQYNNRDNFGKIQFANVGAGFQPLVFERNPEQNLELLPTNKSFGILGITDIKYYDVKTPTTTFIYHSSVRNGGGLQSTYTQNIGKNINIALEYYGLRSEGHYQNSLTSNNHTLFSGHYVSENKKYQVFAHYLHQNMNAEEFGGIADLSVFLSGNNDFDNRENLEVNLQNSDSRFSYRRYYLSHQFAPFNSDKIPFKINHTLYHQGNKYFFAQEQLEPYFYTNAEDIFTGMPLNSKKFSKKLSNTVSLLWDNARFKLEAGARVQNLKFGTNAPDVPDPAFTPKTYSESRFGAIGRLQIKLWEKFDLNSYAEFSNGKAFGNFLLLENTASFEPLLDYKATVHLNFQSLTPSFNFLLNSSPYYKFNYDFSNFQNQNILEAGGKINLKFFDTEIFANYFRIDQFAYLDANSQPNQAESSVNISQIGGDATFSYNKFHLNARLLFQSTLANKDLFPAPNFIGRGNLYWQSKAFKKAAEIQTGVKVYYFTKFDSRLFSPVLNEFTLPGSQGYAIGGKPIVDLYFNLKVKRMFFFVEGQHFNELFMDNRSYAAPYYPVSDFRLNIGIVWYLFH